LMCPFFFPHPILFAAWIPGSAPLFNRSASLETLSKNMGILTVNQRSHELW